MRRNSQPMHVRTNGRSYRLDARPEVRRMTDDDVARYAEESLGMRRGTLADHAVDRDENNVVIRPWAVWG
ncbi:MAG: hypothetical protein GY719_33285 [bacterium]|nr:hypothetical protein [bacterium]